jgi:putative heme-binding domain-containing protein
VLARMTSPRAAEQTTIIADALVGLDRKFERRKLNRDNNWPPRIAELHAALNGKDPALNAAMLTHADFAWPGNALFTRAPGFDRRRAAERFLAAAEKDPNFAWNAELVQLMAELPPDRRRTVLLRLWDRGGFEDAILPILAKDPRPDDRPKLFDGLRSPQLAQIKTCLSAIEVLPVSREPGELLALVRTLRSLPDDKAAAPVADRLAAYLRRVTGQSFGRDRTAWTDWLTKTHPDVAAKLGGPDGVDVADWQKRFARIDWSRGDGDRGQAIFGKASCMTCHSGGQALGPDLRGVGGRFSRDDLLTAIVQPSKDVPARYRTTQITTTDGKVYQGLIVYEAVDGLILQTGAATTVRIGGGQIESRGVTETSLMPAGLLDKLSDGEIADLVVYLRALK